MAASRELLKPRRNTSRLSSNQSKDFEIHHTEKKPINTGNYNSSGKNTSQTANVRGNWNTRKSTDGSVNANNKSTLNTTVNEEENRLQQKPSHQHAPSTSQKNNDYVPIGARINLVEINMEEDVEQAEAAKNQNKILEDLNEESFVKKRVSSVSKFIEADSNFRDNMAESLGSTIVPRTNNCSGFNETFENFLGEGVSSRFQNEERKFIGDNLSGNNSKCYDLPVSVSNIGGQLAKSSNELDSARNKIMKRKQKIEAKRQAAYDQGGYFLSQPGITENSEESISSFQKTMEYDSLQKPTTKKGKALFEDTLGPRESCNDESNKRASLSPTPNIVENTRNSEPQSQTQSRMMRSTSGISSFWKRKC